MNETTGCDEKCEGVPEEVMSPNSITLKELLEIIHGIESTEDRVLAADPNLGKSMVINHGVEKIFTHLLSYTT